MNFHTTNIRPRYSETDQMGIIYHSNYFTWFEVARTSFLKERGMSYREMERQGIFLPVIEVNCKYISSALYDDNLTLEVWIEEFQSSRMKFHYRILRQEEELLATGFTEHVFFDKNKKRPVNLKKAYPEVYQLLEKIYQS
ncbi:acyl-CoA thioesterase [Isachenkonia alkalipeptolytica]|uniref:Acyl-CoA thioesterase n=1 Tax=Isachenkonia alkalipeptolytica TaxID=2565777 RepID=A0AA43XIQ0_9CLOT|nr:thioesterase family protein [Isachenkonia alkalipeptolytica]NBG87307.1 acyl-CoA thioesterase [Isachenkonia alkalipeptolytica]